MKTKNKNRKYIAFYKRWWFWAIVCLLVVLTCFFLLIEDINLRTTIIGICGIWGSTFATIFIGIVAECQNEKFEFRSRKESIIKDIREEERIFLNDFNNVGVSSKYIDLAVGIINHCGDGNVEEVHIIAQHQQAMDDLYRFMQNIGLYEYCPYYAKELIAKIKDMISYLQHDLNPAMINPLDKNYKEKAKDFAEYIINWSKSVNEIRVKYIASFHVLISLITKCQNLESLNKQIDRISCKSQDLREEIILLNHFKNSRK